MAIITCWALKGGSGTTVVAAGIALGGPGAVLVDLDGELPAALGIAEPAGQGLTEWLGSDAPPSAIGRVSSASARARSIGSRSRCSRLSSAMMRAATAAVTSRT